MKTEQELIELKKEVESLNKKLSELTEKELSQVTGGANNFHKTFTKSITLAGTEIRGKSVNVNEVLTLTLSSKTPATEDE